MDAERCARELALQLRQDDDRDGVEAVMRTMSRLNCWRQCIEQLARKPPDQVLGEGLRSLWMGYGLTSGELGISAGLKDDLPIFVDALRRHLPPYDGPAVTLYRGQLEARHRAGSYGIAWTPNREQAEEYADYHGTDGTCVILRIEAAPTIIVATLTENYEHEYIIDPRGIQPEVATIAPLSDLKP